MLTRPSPMLPSLSEALPDHARRAILQLVPLQNICGLLEALLCLSPSRATARVEPRALSLFDAHGGARRVLLEIPGGLAEQADGAYLCDYPFLWGAATELLVILTQSGWLDEHPGERPATVHAVASAAAFVHRGGLPATAARPHAPAPAVNLPRALLQMLCVRGIPAISRFLTYPWMLGFYAYDASDACLAAIGDSTADEAWAFVAAALAICPDVDKLRAHQVRRAGAPPTVWPALAVAHVLTGEVRDRVPRALEALRALAFLYTTLGGALLRARFDPPPPHLAGLRTPRWMQSTSSQLLQQLCLHWAARCCS